MTFDEARETAAAWARRRSLNRPDDRLVLIWDPTARLRVAVKFAPGTLQKDDRTEAIEGELVAALGTFFSGDVLVYEKKAKTSLDHVFDTAWILGEDLPGQDGPRG